MTVAIVKKREWTNKGVDIFERNVVPPLPEYEGVETIEYDRADTYQKPKHHWFLGYLGRYKRGRNIVKAIQEDGYDTVFLPYQDLLTFDPSAVDSQIIPYVHDVFPATTTFAGPILTFLARRYVRNLVECELVLCASEQTKADIRYRTPFDNRVEVVYQGVGSRGQPSAAGRPRPCGIARSGRGGEPGGPVMRSRQMSWGLANNLHGARRSVV